MNFLMLWAVQPSTWTWKYTDNVPNFWVIDMIDVINLPEASCTKTKWVIWTAEPENSHHS